MLEQFEARDVPATWTGAVSTDATDPNNWLEGTVPGASDEADFVPTYQVNCVGLSGALGSIQMDSGYTGTVTLGGAATITGFDIEGGALVAPDALSLGSGSVSGGALTAQADLSCSSLDANGGSTTVQGTATLGTLNLNGSTSVALSGGGTVTDAEVWAGALSLGAAVTAEVLGLYGGEVDQATDADLTITGAPSPSGDAFTWTGGTLNNTANLATVTLTGSATTATIAPASAGTVNLGSNFTLANGASAEMREGTVTVTNSDLTFDVLASSGFTVNPGTGLSAVISSTVSTHFRVEPGAAWTLSSGNWTFQGEVRNQGTFTLGGETLAFILGNAFVDPNDPDSSYSYLQSAGATYLYGSSTLLTGAQRGVKMSDGILATKEASTDRSNHDSSAVISARDLWVTGGDIYIGYGFSHLFFGTLSVTGNVLWTGGTYHPCVRSYGNGSLGDSDLWEAGGRFVFGNNFTPTLAPIVVDVEGAEVDRADSGITYVIIKVDTASDPPPMGAPSYDTDLWDLTTISPPNDNSKVVQYNLVSK